MLAVNILELKNDFVDGMNNEDLYQLCGSIRDPSRFHGKPCPFLHFLI